MNHTSEKKKKKKREAEKKKRQQLKKVRMGTYKCKRTANTFPSLGSARVQSS